MAVSEAVRKQYTPTIGVECHVQLKTNTKLFAPVGNDARDADPNTLISHICVGMPGALPVLNGHAVTLAIRAGLALNAHINHFSKFERKHYFYPDLPKGYQISQYEQPIVGQGEVTIHIDGLAKKIRITRAHLEEDAGKNTHPEGADFSLVDLNRAGTPLLEIVSEPDIHSAAEAKAYAHELYLLMKYADVSDVDLYHGNMRFDVNVSVSKTAELGTRAEVKNLNSFRSVENAVHYEIDRQIELLEKGEKIVQETRGWDEAKQKTVSQRGKEEAHDYRYMPDPDIPPIVLSKERIELERKQMGIDLEALRSNLHAAGANEMLIESILDEPVLANFIIEAAGKAGSVGVATNITQWLGQLVPKMAAVKNLALQDLSLNSNHLLRLSEMYDEGLISSTQAKTILEEVVFGGQNPEEYAQKHGMQQLSDEGEIEKIVADVINENQQAANDVASGELKAIGFLVGQVMKKSGGKANPGMAQQIIKKQLGV